MKRIADRTSCFMAGLIAFLAVENPSLHAQTRESDDIPAFVLEGIYPAGPTTVSRVVEMDSTDVVVLSEGLRRGLRTGMICQVAQGDQAIGEIILVEVLPHAAVGLITKLAEAVSIQPGDRVAVKTLKFN